MQPERVREVINFEGSAGKEYHGRNYGFDVSFYWLDTSQARADNARSMLSSQNNVLRMMRDQATGEYAHPVVYVEHGGHEFWPRPRLGARKSHRGPPSPGRPR